MELGQLYLCMQIAIEERMMNTNVIYYYQSAKQTILFFCYWLIFALSYSTMDSGRIGTWNQKHVFHIHKYSMEKWVFLGQVEPGFYSFFAHIFDMIFRPEEKSSSMYVTKFVWILNKTLLDYKPIINMITGNTIPRYPKIWIQVPDLSLNSICDGAVLNFDLTVHLQHLHISDGGGFSCNWNVMCLWYLLGSIITRELKF